MGNARAQGKHAGLTREQVLRAALRLVDQEGAGALSMRRLARELDVEAMTLYHHVRNKQMLEDAIIEHVLAEALPNAEALSDAESRSGDQAAAPWQTVLAHYANALHRALATHPNCVPLIASRPAITTRNLIQLEHLLRILTDAGFTPQVALRMVHATAASVVGQHLARPADAAEANAAGELDADELPLVREALATGFPTVEARFTLVLDALITGFERLLGEQGARPDRAPRDSG